MNWTINKGDTAITMLENVSMSKFPMTGYLENITQINIFNQSSFMNESDYNDADLENKEYIFDRLEVRVIFITLYSLVFCCCFFGEWILFCIYSFSGKYQMSKFCCITQIFRMIFLFCYLFKLLNSKITEYFSLDTFLADRVAIGNFEFV